MSESCQCHQVGGPFIAEDPNCPVHGPDGYEAQLDDVKDSLTIVTMERDDALTEIARLKALIEELESDIQEYAEAQPPI